MPYKTIKELPANLQDILPNRAQEIYVGAFNSSWDGTCKDREDKEGCANAIAWTAVKNGFKKTEEGKWVELEKTETIEEVEIFKVGTWNGHTYTEGDLQKIVDNFNELFSTSILKPPLKLGHSKNQKLLQEDGYPAAGWITACKKIGDTIIATLADVPRRIAELIRNKAYKQVSCEMNLGGTWGGKVRDIVLKAVALLGGDIPAVESLADIEALYGKELVYFKDLQEKEEEQNMADKIVKTEDGVEFPAEAYAYVPDAEKPSTWKLRLWEDPTKKITREQLGAAAAAFSPGGFRGQKVDIPAEDVAKVKAKIVSAYRGLDVKDEEIPKQLLEKEGAKNKEEEVKEMEKIEALEKENKELKDKVVASDKALEEANESLAKVNLDRVKEQNTAIVDTLIKEGKALPKEKDSILHLLTALNNIEPTFTYTKEDKTEEKISARELYKRDLLNRPVVVDLDKEKSKAKSMGGKGIVFSNTGNLKVDDEEVAERANAIMEEYTKRGEKIDLATATKQAFNELKE